MDPQFEIVPKRIATHRRPPRRTRRSWATTLEALTKGTVIFFSDDQLSDQDVKYIQLALARRGKGERLTTVRVEHAGVAGRQLELSK